MSAINVLVVTDGIFNFAPTDLSDDTFTITAFLNTLRNSTNPVINVTTAHRDTNPTADFQHFNFATSVPDLSAYDVLCLIGYDGSNFMGHGTLAFISDDELQVLSDFMEKGGGILATGDHDGLGSLMCGKIPRVRSMRKWFSPSDDDPSIPAAAPRNWPGGGSDRADTLQADHDGHWNFDNQSDDIPQPLTLPGGGTHPILQVPGGPLMGFPDHMHEGEVIVPWTFTDTLTFNGQPFTEYPTIGGHQEQPIIIARGAVIGGHPTPVEGAACEINNFFNEVHNTNAKTIGILCTYDGHNAGVGRIVTDSSFHHYTDLNLIGDPCGASTPDDFKQQGFSASPFWAQMQAFFINTIVWLNRLVKECTVTTDRSTVGKDEVNAGLHLGSPMVIEKAFYVVVDGFLHEELSITAATLSGIPNVAPAISFSPSLAAAPAGQKRVVATSCAVDGGVLLDAPQRFTWTYSLQFFDDSDFTAEMKPVILNASITSTSGTMVSGQGVITLTTQPNPYETDGPASWLSVDLQVFHLRQHEFLPHTPSIQLSGSPNDFITQLLRNTGGGYNDPALTRAPLHPFDLDLVANQDSSTIELSSTIPSSSFPPLPAPVFNFAVARVRYKALATPAPNVRVFFRMFQASTTSTEFQPSTTYRTGGTGGSKIPLLGVVNQEVVSIPFFAAPRVSPSNPQGLNAQPDPVNVGPVSEAIPADGSGTEVQVYFGCWLDINQNVAQLPDPNHSASAAGPYTPVQSIQQAIMGKHQCLVAEINLDPPEPQISIGVTPGNSDKLAQRNLTIVGAASPHRIPITFDIKPTALTLPLNKRPDELMLHWGNLPPDSTANIYLPGINADKVLAEANQLYASHDLSRIDLHTLGCKARGITYIPIPQGVGSNYVGLLTVDLPPTVKRGQHFSVLAQQITNISGKQPVPHSLNVEIHQKLRKEELQKYAGKYKVIEWRMVLGSFQLNIPVTTKETLLDPEERLLAVMRWNQLSLPTGHRWYPVLSRYIDIIAGRVKALNGDPTLILPSPTGYNPGKYPQPGQPGGHHHHPGDHHHHPGDHPGHHIGEEYRLAFSGKIDGILFDRYGDFEGFILRTTSGEHSFFSREQAMEDLAKIAWRERIAVTVFAAKPEEHLPLAIIFRHGPGHF